MLNLQGFSQEINRYYWRRRRRRRRKEKNRASGSENGGRGGATRERTTSEGMVRAAGAGKEARETKTDVDIGFREEAKNEGVGVIRLEWQRRKVRRVEKRRNVLAGDSEATENRRVCDDLG